MFSISNGLFYSAADDQVHIVSLSVQQVSVWYGDLFQVYGILFFCDRNAGSSVVICGRHLRDQVLSVLVTVNAIDCTCDGFVTLAVLFYDF